MIKELYPYLPDAHGMEEECWNVLDDDYIVDDEEEEKIATKKLKKEKFKLNFK